MLKVAMLSKWHVHAEGYAKDIINTGKVKITAVWDDDEKRGSEWAKELGCDYEKDLDKLLARSDVEAVVCDAPTTQHKEVLVKAAKAGKHIFTEKSLSHKTTDAIDIAEAVEAAGKTFTISLPQRIDPVIQLAKKMIDKGEFGKISLVRIRNGHNGVSGGWLPEYWFEEKDAGGGALMDLGCHPMYVSFYLLGKPTKITSLLTAPFGSKVDEAATASIQFENDAVCTAETSFITYNTPGAVEIYGSDATLLAYGGDVRLYHKNIGEFSKDFVRPNLPDRQEAPIVQWVNACVDGTGTPPIFSARQGVELTRLLENSYISNKEDRIVEL